MARQAIPTKAPLLVPRGAYLRMAAAARGLRMATLAREYGCTTAMMSRFAAGKSRSRALARWLEKRLELAKGSLS
jgi:transcriptional regulator with XRE-family HTH domain